MVCFLTGSGGIPSQVVPEGSQEMISASGFTTISYNA
jgi:hypothetical protein